MKINRNYRSGQAIKGEHDTKRPDYYFITFGSIVNPESKSYTDEDRNQYPAAETW